MKCLIVDDNTMARTVLRNMVKQIDDLVIRGEYATAIDAFNHLQREEVDLLLLDVEMPGMTGLELIKSLKKPPLAILITAKSDYAVDGFHFEKTEMTFTFAGRADLPNDKVSRSEVIPP